MQFKIFQEVILVTITNFPRIQAQVHDTGQSEGPGAATVALDPHLIHIHFQHYEAVVPQIQPGCPPFASGPCHFSCTKECTASNEKLGGAWGQGYSFTILWPVLHL